MTVPNRKPAPKRPLVVVIERREFDDPVRERKLLELLADLIDARRRAAGR